MQGALPLLESVPNISVGRDAALVDELVGATRDGAAAGARRDGSRALVVDVHRDHDHDRTVLTLLGRGEALAGALQALARATIDAVDVHAGHGVHPRVGVLDVLPVIALDERDESRQAAHDLVERMARLVGDELGVPVAAYGLRRDGTPEPGAAYAGAARRGGPGVVAERVAAGELRLLAGPAAPHPTAGATIVGVRDLLVAFNVDLAVDDLDLARGIAARIRATSGRHEALPGVRALGLRLASRGICQVSTNVEQYRSCGPARVLQAVAALAVQEGAAVGAAELVGLAPRAALGPLRYACTAAGVPLLAASEPALEAAIAQLQPPT